MRTIEFEEFDNDFFRLVEEAAKGDVLVVTRNGKPLVKVVPVEEFGTGETFSPADTSPKDARQND